MKFGQTIVLAGTEGPIVTTVKALLTPAKMQDLRVKVREKHLTVPQDCEIGRHYNQCCGRIRIGSVFRSFLIRFQIQCIWIHNTDYNQGDTCCQDAGPPGQGKEMTVPQDCKIGRHYNQGTLTAKMQTSGSR